VRPYSRTSNPASKKFKSHHELYCFNISFISLSSRNIKFLLLDLLSIFNIDFSGVRISYHGESLFREINGSLTSWWTVIDDFNNNAGTLARLWHALVCSPDAFDSIPSPTSCPIAPYHITCCSDHHALVLISVA
jgi:hypothetical protein